MKPPSNSISTPRSVRWLGWALLVVIIYASVSFVVLGTSLVLLQRRIISDLPWVSSVQEFLYSKGMRNIWQTQADCVDFDPDLIYKPKNGSCQFSNLEFNNVLHFTDEGRITGPKPTGTGIAVLGDSHAMGWGVEDGETFSSELQRLTKRPIYNMAVSSYGTARELIRMEKSGLLGKVDTIIIQYCDNDLKENIQFRPDTLQANQQKFSVITLATPHSPPSDVIGFLGKSYRFTLRAPFSGLKQVFFAKPPKDFSRHYPHLIARIKKHDSIRKKRIIIFYSNAHGKKFSAFPSGQDSHLKNVEFTELHLDRTDYYRFDDHLNALGHKKVAKHLFNLIQTDPRP